MRLFLRIVELIFNGFLIQKYNMTLNKETDLSSLSSTLDVGRCGPMWFS